MQTQKDQRMAVAELAQKLLSRDPVVFNSTINQTFAARAQYTGHGLAIAGASHLKHVAWLFNLIDSGPAAVIEEVQWYDESSTAQISSVRFIRPRLFPLFTLAFRVKSQLKFHADGESNSSTAEKGKALYYVTSFQEQWLAESLAQRFGIVSLFLHYLFTPIVTWFVLLLSNVTFDVHARLASSHRHHIEPSVRRIASDHLPSDVTRNLDNGFQRGRSLAEGSGARLFDLVDTLAYFPLSAIEVLTQAGFQLAGAVSPIALPLPFVYYSHVEDAFHGIKINSASQRVEQMNRSLHPKPTQDDVTPPESNGNNGSEAATTTATSTPPPAKVEVRNAVSSEETEQAKTVDIASRIGNEAHESPADATTTNAAGKKEPLYDQLRRDGIVGPGAPPMQHAPSSSGESTSDEGGHHHHSHDGSAHSAHASKTGSATKKHKKKSKKSKAAAKAEDHAPPPTFMEGLEHAQGAK